MVKDDADEFAEKVLALLSSPALSKKKSIEALEWGKKWKISNLTPKLVSCYENAISERTSSENI